MNSNILALVCLAVSGFVPDPTHGHGRLIEPPSRASMWRYGFDTPENYNDNQLFCGGFNKQWTQNGGNCGVCGDDYSIPQPRPHEGGGHYGTGTIARTYTQGQTIDITVQITAQHQGWFEFRLCPHNDPSTPVTHACLDQNLLQFVDGTTRVSGIDVSKDYHYQIILPADVTCSQCVIQWKYHTGNSWGTDPDGSAGVGKGPQEQFYGCADVTIAKSDEPGIRPPLRRTTPSTDTTSSTTSSITSTTTTSSATTPPRIGNICRASGAYEDVENMDEWCDVNCAAGYCPDTHCKCFDMDDAIPDSQSTGENQVCTAKGRWISSMGRARANSWCQGNCDATHSAVHHRCHRRCHCH